MTTQRLSEIEGDPLVTTGNCMELKAEALMTTRRVNGTER